MHVIVSGIQHRRYTKLFHVISWRKLVSDFIFQSLIKGFSVVPELYSKSFFSNVINTSF